MVSQDKQLKVVYSIYDLMAEHQLCGQSSLVGHKPPKQAGLSVLRTLAYATTSSNIPGLHPRLLPSWAVTCSSARSCITL